MTDLVLFEEEPIPAAAQSSRAEASARADQIRLGLVTIATLTDNIKAAWAARDWVPLGYDSWDTYVENEFGEGRLPAITRDQRRAIVADLRDGAMSTRAIAVVLGVGQATIVRDLDATEPNESVEPPARIMGADGKERPATRPTQTARLDTPQIADPPSKPEPQPPADMDVIDDVDVIDAEVVGETRVVPAPVPNIGRPSTPMPTGDEAHTTALKAQLQRACQALRDEVGNTEPYEFADLVEHDPDGHLLGQVADARDYLAEVHDFLTTGEPARAAA